MSKVAIVAALEREIRPLAKDWHADDKEHDGRRFRFLVNNEFVLVCGGIGAEAARRAAEAVIMLYRPEIVYSAGFAGALDPALKVGHVLRPGRIVNAGDGSSTILDGVDGVLVTFGSIASPAQKANLRESFGARAVDMEAAAVARAAEARGIPFEAIKVVSDVSDFELPSMERFVDSKGKFSEWRFALFAAVRPWMWGRVLHLARNSRRASQALCTALRNLDPEIAASQRARPAAI